MHKTLKTYEQYVTCPTTLNKSTIDLCYGTVPGAFKSLTMPPFGASYHTSVLLVPIYKPICRKQVCTKKTVKCWTEESIATLQACLDCTDWDVFYSSCSDLNELTSTVSSYISFCVESNIPCKDITVFPNNKPWVTKELKSVINRKKRIFYTGNSQDKKEINRELRNEIRKAKIVYRDKVELKYSSGDLREAWRGIKSMSSISQGNNNDRARNTINIEGTNEADLPNAFNIFYSRFEKNDFSINTSTLRESLSPISDIVIEQDDVRNLLKRVNIRKAPGPDHICGLANSVVFSSISSNCHLRIAKFLICGNPQL